MAMRRQGQTSTKETTPSVGSGQKRSPRVKEVINYYNDRTKKVSLIPRLTKSSVNQDWQPQQLSNSNEDLQEETGGRFSRYSAVPTASSVYSDPGDAIDEYDPTAQIRPLFGEVRLNAQTRYSIASQTARKPVANVNPTTPPRSSQQSTLAERAAIHGVTGLGLETSVRHFQPWQGNAGTANLMTPIADASVASQDEPNVSPVSNRSVRRLAENERGSVSREPSPGPTISDIDDRERRSDQGSAAVAPSALDRVQNSFGSAVRDDQMRRGLESTPENKVTEQFSQYDYSPNYPTKDKQQVSRFSWTTKATELTPTKASFDLTRPPPPAVPPKYQQNEADHSLGSRFSWTTKDTRPAAMPHSPPDSPPPMPDMQRLSIMDRPHPFATPVPSPRDPVIRRKPTPSTMSAMTYASQQTTGSDKRLPLSPPELESMDIITSLNAQLEDCAYRRINLQKLIDAHTALRPQNPLVQDLAMRRANRERVEQFESDLAAVKVREHELGLKLHRAWKRREQEAPTAIWVRRICS